MGDVTDSTLVHINDLPIPIPIHQRGFISSLYDYYCQFTVRTGESFVLDENRQFEIDN